MLENKDIQKLIEAQEPIFATKRDLQDMKNDILEFKSEILDGQDEILKEIRALRQEKTIGDEQDKRRTKVLEIHNNALKSNKILSEQQSSAIDALRAFQINYVKELWGIDIEIDLEQNGSIVENN